MLTAAPIPVTGLAPPQPSNDGPMIAVLGDVRVRGARRTVTSQQLSLLSYLTVVGEGGRDAVIDALWDGRPVSSGRFANLISETRRAIGHHHLPGAVDGRYRVHGITSDLGLFKTLAEPAATDAGIEGPARALELVRGVPFTVPAGRYWRWPFASAGLCAAVEIMITDTAAALAVRALGSGDLTLARWACEKGLLAAPLDERLTTLLTSIYLQLGKATIAHRLVAEWEARIERLGCGSASPAVRQQLSDSG